MRLKDKVCLITGGGQGIGRSVALKMAGEGAHIAVVDVDLYRAEQCVTQVEALGRKALAIKADVTSLEESAGAVQKAVSDLGALHILVNNAGITRDNLILRMKEEDWDLVLNVNLKGAFNFTKSALKVMSKQRYGRIINIASIVGLTGNAGQANYSASKAGLIGLTKTIALEFAKRNITVNAIAPGFIETAMTGALSDEIKEVLAGRIPMGKLGTSDDVAMSAVFLASQESAYITGHVLNVNGGMYM